jgi:hypothetical protein
MPTRPISWEYALTVYRKHLASKRHVDGALSRVEDLRELAYRFGIECPEDVTLHVLSRFRRSLVPGEVQALENFLAFLAQKRLI